MKKICFISLSLLLWTCNSPGSKKSEVVIAEETVIEEKFEDFSPVVKKKLDSFFNSDFSGTFLIYKNGRLYKDALGSREEEGDEMQVTDVFQLASVSKVITATLIMKMMEESKIHVDSTVQTYLPDFPFQDVRISHLLSHTGGVPEYMYFMGKDTFRKSGKPYWVSNQDMYQFMLNAKPERYFDAGEHFDYCNTNYALLALIIEKIEGKSFRSVVKNKIFKPTGMRFSYYFGDHDSAEQSFEVTGRYSKYRYTDTYYLDGILGDKGLYSNVDDMFRFFKGLKSESLISKKSLEMMQKEKMRISNYGRSYAWGYRLKKSGNHVWTYHNGWWRGFWTSFWIDIENDICLVILTNNKKSSHVDKQSLADYLFKLKLK